MISVKSSKSQREAGAAGTSGQGSGLFYKKNDGKKSKQKQHAGGGVAKKHKSK
jgi:hypothetical protein